MKDERSDRYKINGRLAPLASDNTAGNSVRTKEISRIQGSIKNQNVGTQLSVTDIFKRTVRDRIVAMQFNDGWKFVMFLQRLAKARRLKKLTTFFSKQICKSENLASSCSGTTPLISSGQFMKISAWSSFYLLILRYFKQTFIAWDLLSMAWEKN